ncbi:MAG: SCO family protein [Planctomycetota bacterium]
MRKLLISTGVSLLVLVLALAVVFPAINSSARSEPTEELPRLWDAPDFTLTNQTGETITADDLRGQVWAADFFFTSCPGICPMLSANMRGLNDALADHPRKSELQLVSFSLDPENDTVDVLAEYARAFEITTDEWQFLTGPRQAIWDLSIDGFKLEVQDTPDDLMNPILHSGKVVLVDREGVIRGFYDGLTPLGMAELQADIRRLLEEG